MVDSVKGNIVKTGNVSGVDGTIIDEAWNVSGVKDTLHKDGNTRRRRKRRNFIRHITQGTFSYNINKNMIILSGSNPIHGPTSSYEPCLQIINAR